MVSVTVINGCVNLSDLTDGTSWFTNLQWSLLKLSKFATQKCPELEKIPKKYDYVIIEQTESFIIHKTERKAIL